MKGLTLSVALLSAALCLTLPSAPVQNLNSSETRAAHTAKAEKPVQSAEEADVTVAKVEMPKTPEPESQPEPVAIPELPESEESAKAFIYQKESNDNPAAENYLGCYGLGQDCNGIVKDRCGADYSCQDSFFTDYMLRRYGTWQAAKSFWLSRVPINGRDVGHWW